LYHDLAAALEDLSTTSAPARLDAVAVAVAVADAEEKEEEEEEEDEEEEDEEKEVEEEKQKRTSRAKPQAPRAAVGIKDARGKPRRATQR